VAGATIDEHIAVWEHLSRAGFMNGSYTYATPEANGSAPTNPYSRYLQLIYDTQYAGATGSRHNLKTGNQIPSDILAEVDRKIDDGVPTAGSFRHSIYGGATGAATLAAEPGGPCATAGVAPAPDRWNASTPGPDCGGTSLF